MYPGVKEASGMALPVHGSTFSISVFLFHVFYSNLCASVSFIECCKNCFKCSDGCYYKVVAFKITRNSANLWKAQKIPWERKAGWCKASLSSLPANFFSMWLCIHHKTGACYALFPGPPCCRTPAPADGRRELRWWRNLPRRVTQSAL